jgi:hypothetical protein
LLGSGRKRGGIAVLAGGVKDKTHVLDEDLRAGHHDQQVACARAGHTTGHRRVDDLHALLGQPFGPSLDRCRTDGRHHHNHGTGCERRRGGVVAVEHALDLGWGDDHEDKDVRARRGLGDGPGRFHPVGAEGRDGTRVDVVAGNYVASSRCAAGHGQAHGAQADPSHSCHWDSSIL